MMLGFKDRFVPMIEDGSKTHTIRAGARWKVGMRADLYARPRQRDMRLLFRAVVTRVETIEVIPPPMDWKCPLCYSGRIHCHEVWSKVFIAGDLLNSDEADGFAWRDGFRSFPKGHCHERHTSGSFGLMMEYWRDQLPFSGQLIHWDYEGRFTEIPVKHRHVIVGPRGGFGPDWSAAHVW